MTVSAAAGSGKTSVLAERCAYLVCDAPPETRCSVDQLVVLTFTEAAAAEMRARVRAAIAERAAAQPQDARLRRELLLLDDAHVTTIHAFCRWFIGQHFLTADVDPACAILEPEEGSTILQDVAHNTVRARLELNDRATRELLLYYMHGNTDTLAEELVRLHDFVGSLDDGPEWCRRCRAACSQTPEELITNEARTFEEELTRQLLGLDACIARLLDGVEGGQAIATRLTGYRALLAECRSALQHDVTQYEALVLRVASFTFSRFTFKADSGSADDKMGRDMVAQVKKWHDKRMRRFTRFALGERSSGLGTIAPHVNTVFDLLDEVTANYGDIKRRRAVVDFDDLEHLALGLLRNTDGTTSDIARTMHARFKHVLVDEYQDVSPLQEAILRLLSRESNPDAVNNLFCVGDVKQSIYRFRHADPTVFAARGAREDSAEHRLVNLSANFRSRPMILDAVNALFERILIRALGDVDYDDAARLVPGKSHDHDGHPIELHIVAPVEDDHTDENIERQARVIGQRIEALVANGTYDYGDMVILLRAATGRAEQMAAVLQRMGIPTAADTASGFFSAVEVSDVLSLLKVIDNRRQDIALAATMRSGVAGIMFDDAQLAAIKDTAPTRSFHDAVLHYGNLDSVPDAELAHRVRDFLERIASFSRWIERSPFPTALWRIYTSSGCLAAASTRPGGAQRRANLLALHRRAVSFGSGDGRSGLHAFLQFVEHMHSRKQDLGLANPAAPAPRIVRIMTVHNSKGLEFPVVFVANLEKTFNLSDSRQTVVYDRIEGLGLPIFDPHKLLRYPSLLFTRATEALRRGETAEEMRILYVALTRARDRLILVGSADEDRLLQTRRVWSGHEGPLPEMALLNAQSHLDWLLPAIAALPHQDVSWHDAEAGAGDDDVLFNVFSAAPLRVSPADDPTDRDACRRAAWAALDNLPQGEDSEAMAPAISDVFKRLAFVYPWSDAGAVPAVTSVTALAKTRAQPDEPPHHLAVNPFEPPAPSTPVEGPEFVTPDRRPSAAAVGTATHLFFEQLDYNRPDELAGQLATLVDDGHLEQRAADAIDLDAVAWFLQTPLGQRMTAARGRLRREVAVLYRRPAEDLMPGGWVGTDDFTIIRGMVDAILPVDGAYEVIDFKTDRLTAEQLPDRIAVYRPQLQYYAMALEDIWRTRVPRAALVFLDTRHVEWIDFQQTCEQMNLWD